MTQEFNREDRYIVIKRKDLEKVPASYRKDLVDPLPWLQVHLPRRECLVVESDWPEYETVWQMIERRVTGQPVVAPAEELQAVLHWRDKHAQAIKERDALQQRLNIADQRVCDLQSELTKARELLGEINREVFFSNQANGQYHRPAQLMLKAVRAFLAHQSAPAARVNHHEQV